MFSSESYLCALVINLSSGFVVNLLSDDLFQPAYTATVMMPQTQTVYMAPQYSPYQPVRFFFAFLR
jgi:hypothetical protein